MALQPGASLGASPLEQTPGELVGRPAWQLLLVGAALFALGLVGYKSPASILDGGSGLVGAMASALILPLAVLGLCWLYRYLKMNDRLGIDRLGMNPEGAEGIAVSAVERILWPVGGSVAVLAALILLEVRQPYYFTQDDNLAQNLPAILQGCRSFFSGVYPEWNPYQYMGSPSSSLGYFSLTYPFTYVCYWLAKTVLHNEYATVEVFVFVHLLVGYWALYWAVRREGCRPAIAMLAAGCCCVSGFALIFSRSWFQFSTILPWTALMVICVQSLVGEKTVGERIGWKWILTFGFAIGMLGHVGHTQMWVYSVMLVDVAIALLLFAGAIPVRNVAACVSAHLIGLAIAAPLLFVQILATHEEVRSVESTGIASGLKGLFIPDSISASPHPLNMGKGYPIGEMYYFGTLFMVMAALLLLSLLATRWTKATVGRNVWFLCALVAFVLALGNRGLLWTAMAYMPGLDRFRFPFKLLGYVVLFSAIGGAVALERLFRKWRWSGRVEIPLVILTGAVLAYHCTLCTAAFYVYNFTPYPKADANIAGRLVPGDERNYPKVFPLEVLNGEVFACFPGGNRGRDPHFVDSFLNQWPTVQGAFSLCGYDLLTSEAPVVQRMIQNVHRDTRRALFEYGVKYALQYDPPELAQIQPRAMVKLEDSTPVYESSTVILNELPAARPMAYMEEQPEPPLAVRFDGGGATITTSGAPIGGRLVLNMLWRPEIRAKANGAEVLTSADDWGRIVIRVPAGSMHTPGGAQTVRVSFRPPWSIGFALAGVALLLGVAVGWWFVSAQDGKAAGTASLGKA